MSSQLASLRIAIDSGELKKATHELDKLTKSGLKAECGTDKLEKSFTGLNTTMISAAAATYGVKTAITAVINSFIALENAQIGVKKTTGLSGIEFQKLDKSLKSMATTMSGFKLNGLYDIAEAAGQLGIQGVKDITEFTRVISMVGLTTELSAKEAGTAFAKLSKQMGEPIANTERVASVFNELSNTTAATVGDLLTFSSRIAGAGKTVGLSTAEIAGLSATLSDLGVNYEVGGSAISRTLMLMAADSKKFATATGEDSIAFASMVEDEPVKALSMLLKKMKTLNASDSINLLKKVGLGGIESSGVLLKVANSTETLTKNLKIANKEYALGTSMQIEYATASEGLQAQNTKLSASLTLLGADIGSKFKKPLLEASSQIQNIVDDIRASDIALSEFIYTLVTPIAGIHLFLTSIDVAFKTIPLYFQDATLGMEKVWNRMLMEFQLSARNVLPEMFADTLGFSDENIFKSKKAISDIEQSQIELALEVINYQQKLEDVANSYLQIKSDSKTATDSMLSDIKSLAKADLSFAGYGTKVQKKEDKTLDTTSLDKAGLKFQKQNADDLIAYKKKSHSTFNQWKLKAYAKNQKTDLATFELFAKQRQKYWDKELNKSSFSKTLGKNLESEIKNAFSHIRDFSDFGKALESAVSSALSNSVSSALSDAVTTSLGKSAGSSIGGALLGGIGGAAVGIAFNALFAKSTAKSTEEQVKSSFDNFMKGLDKASKALEKFGNVGSSTENKIKAIQKEQNRVSNLKVTGSKSKWVWNGHGWSTERSQKIDGKWMTGYLSDYKQQLQSSLKAQLSDVVTSSLADTLDISKLSTSQISNLTSGIDIKAMKEYETQLNNIALAMKTNTATQKSLNTINKKTGKLNTLKEAKLLDTQKATEILSDKKFAYYKDMTEAIKIQTDAEKKLADQKIASEKKKIASEKKLADQRASATKAINDAMLGSISYLSEIEKLQYANNIYSGAITQQDKVNSSRTIAELSQKTTRTKEDYIPIFAQYLNELKKQGEQTTLTDVNNTLNEINTNIVDQTNTSIDNTKFGT